ncbi:MAG: DUF262 domain-containing protein [FCB group bacterium]|nr:DUF262 domain-containing protein [FCB group bacterium]
MAYQADTIANVIKNRINDRYFLPAIQREFVWQPEQISALFDSLMRKYPISSFLFWELEDANREKWEVYKFIDNFHQGGTHNELANSDGVSQLTLVLDGQQRLTSLLIGLRGTYTTKKKYKRWDNPDAWMKQKLYIDLLKDSQISENNGELGIHYGFKFFECPPENSIKNYWYKVGSILNYDNEDSFDEFVMETRDSLPDDTTKAQLRIFEKNLKRLREVIWKEDVISYYTEHDQNYDRVLDIFVRANEGGTKLSKSDLLLSMVTSKWGEVNAREEIYGFVDRINNDLAHKNNFDKDFIMKSCLVLTDLPVQYKVENFNNTNLEAIYANWNNIKDSIVRALKLVNSFGIDRDTLTSANALIPIIYYLLQRPSIDLLGSTPFDVSNSSVVRQWLSMALLNNVFGGTSDNLLRDLRTILAKHKDSADFPIDEMNAEIAKSGRFARFDDDSIDRFLSITYGRQITFLALTLLYDDNNWGVLTNHQDHIFPQTLFKPMRLKDAGYNDEAIEKYQALFNRLGNLELLKDNENIEKSGKEFSDWITTRDETFKARHLIPDDSELYKLENFEKFLDGREQLITERLRSFFKIDEKKEAEHV